MGRSELEEKVRRAQLIERIREARKQGTSPSALLQGVSPEQAAVQTSVPEDGTRYTGIGKLAIPADYVKMGIDALSTGKPYSEFKEQYDTDKTYIPGDPTAEANSDNPYIQTAIKTAEDIGGDPLNWIGLAARGAEAGATALSRLGKPAAKAVGSLGAVTTLGKVTPKSMEAALAFTPTQQIRAGKTLEQAGATIDPLKKAAQVAMDTGINKLGSTILTDASHPEIFSNLNNVTESYARYLREVARSRGAQGADVYKGINAEQMTLLRRLRMVSAKGEIDAPLIDEIKGSINKMHITGAGNPKLIYEEQKFLQNSVGKVLDDALAASSPELYAANKAYSAAKSMAVGHKGGKLLETARYLPVYAGGAEAIRRTAEGDLPGAVMALGTGIALKNPAAWNVGMGSARLAGQGLTSAMGAVARNPNLIQAGLAGLSALAQQPYAPPSPLTPTNPALAAMSQNFGPSGAVFLDVADTKPTMYSDIASYAYRTGNGHIAPFFEMAAQMGLPGAMQTWQQQQPETWGPVSQMLPKIAMNAIKDSPSIQKELRKGIMFKEDLPVEEKFRLIQKINDKSFFNLPKNNF